MRHKRTLIRNRIAYYLLFITVLSRIIYCSDIDCNCNAELHNDSLYVEINIVNNEYNKIILQNNFWEIGGSETENFFMAYPGIDYIVNSIYMIPADSLKIIYRTEKRDFPILDTIVSPIYIFRNDTATIRLLIKHNRIYSNELYIFIKIPYLINLPYTIIDSLQTTKRYINIDFYNDLSRSNIIFHKIKEDFLLKQHNGKINNMITDFIESGCFIIQK